MSELSRKALGGFIKFHLFLGLLLFLPAWSLRFWEAWTYLILFSISVLLITLYFLKHDPGLIELRLKVGPGAERERSQAIIQAAASLMLVALYTIAGFDHRLRFSAVPRQIVLAADVLVVLGFLIIFFVFRENSYTSGVIAVEAGQQVISTGPYRLIRHPMYAGASLIFLATPLGLGSFWALLAAVSLCGTMIVRLLNEERFLSANLPGYGSYCRDVRYRLVPLVW
jgi:protein-S-isoprenylcysteine O-methyltransferase Ste14